MLVRVLGYGAITTYLVVRIRLTVLARRAESQGDIERAQKYRSMAFKMLLGSIALTLAASLAVVAMTAR